MDNEMERRKEQREFEEKLYSELKQINSRLQRLEDGTTGRQNECTLKYDSRYIRVDNFGSYFAQSYEKEQAKRARAIEANTSIIKNIGVIIRTWIPIMAIMMLIFQKYLGG